MIQHPDEIRLFLLRADRDPFVEAVSQRQATALSESIPEYNRNGAQDSMGSPINPYRITIINSLQDACRGQRALWILCFHCGHAARMSPTRLAGRFGNRLLAELRPYIRCSVATLDGARLSLKITLVGLAEAVTYLANKAGRTSARWTDAITHCTKPGAALI